MVETAHRHLGLITGCSKNTLKQEGTGKERKMKKRTIGFISIVSLLGTLVGWSATVKKNHENIKKKDVRIEKFKNYFDVTNEWIRLKNEGKCLEEYFLKNGWNRIAVYGMGELGNRLTEELKDSAVTVVYAIDQKSDSIFSTLTIKDLEEELPPVDVIVVTPIFAYDEVEEALMDRVEYPIVSLEDVVFSV